MRLKPFDGEPFFIDKKRRPTDIPAGRQMNFYDGGDGL